jgi:hypothetical protein
VDSTSRPPEPLSQGDGPTTWLRDEEAKRWMAQPPRRPMRPIDVGRRWKLTTPALAVVATSVVTVGAAGCGPPQVTTAAPPTVVCSTVLSSGPAGAVVFDATRHLPTINGTTVGGLLIFRVARGCEKGANARWLPSSAAHLVRTAYAADGRAAAVVLKPSGPLASFRLIAKQDGKVVAAATVKLAQSDRLSPRVTAAMTSLPALALHAIARWLAGPLLAGFWPDKDEQCRSTMRTSERHSARSAVIRPGRECSRRYLRISPRYPGGGCRTGVKMAGGTARDVVVFLVRLRPRFSLTPGAGS